jgi:hypothetical protein
MSTFSKREQAILRAGRLLAKNYALDIGLELSNRIKAVMNILVKRGVCTAEEMEDALRATGSKWTTPIRGRGKKKASK